MIHVENVTVRYRLLKERKRTFQAHLISYLKGQKREVQTLWGLRDVSLDVGKGEAWGVIGHNGAGKSTLLKVVSGVIKPAAGKVRVQGRIAPLIELSAGFDKELTGRENVYLNASILGLSRREIDERFEKIVAFSELEDFINAPVRSYSSGMVARLAFSIVTEANADILVVDEVLAVGDWRFKKKSKERILEFKEAGGTVLIVSHHIDEVKKICDRILWLDHGRTRMIGDPDIVVAAYEKEQDGVETMDLGIVVDDSPFLSE